MMICPFCKANIDDDSFFCDQCGKEIFICPKCNRPGKGKMCIFDGTPLVPAKSKTTASPAGSVVSAKTALPSSKPVTQAAADVGELHLVNKNLGLDLKIEDGDIIGRTTGQFVSIFGKYPNVSRQHAQFKLSPNKEWVVTDLGSTNGTKYNNIPLKPMQPQPLSDKSYLQIANIEFYVQILGKSSKGKTETVRI